METISIIIPVYNVEKYILDCLNSVINQTYSNIECLLIDDKSPDNSIAIAKEFIKRYNGNIKFKIISHKTNQGLSAARNTGIKHSIGTYLYFLDSDDEIFPNTIEELYKIAHISKSDFSVGDFKIEKVNTQNETSNPYTYLPINKTGLYTNKDIVKAYFKNQWFAMACNKLISKDFLLKNSLWFPLGLLHEDIYWSFKLASCANRMSIYNSPTYIYKLRSTSITGKITERNVYNMIEILRLCYMITCEKQNPYLKGKLRSIANYTIKNMVTSSSISNDKKMEFISSIKHTIHKTIWHSFPLSISDALKQIILCLPNILIYKIESFYHQQVQ